MTRMIKNIEEQTKPKIHCFISRDAIKVEFVENEEMEPDTCIINSDTAKVFGVSGNIMPVPMIVSIPPIISHFRVSQIKVVAIKEGKNYISPSVFGESSLDGDTLNVISM